MRRGLVLVVLLLALNAGLVLGAEAFAATVVPGWKKGPLIDPAAPYAPENAIVLGAWCTCAALDLYALLLLAGRRLRRLRALWPMVALGLSLGLTELGLRAWLMEAQVTYFRPHPTLHWVVRPNLRDFVNQSGGGTITTNQDGMRGVTVPYEKRPEELRVLVLGDSSNFGHGVEGDEVWSARLEALLADAVHGRTVEVLNGACPGWTTYQGLAFLRETGLRYHPDIVLAGFNNDPGPEFFGDAARVPTGFVRAASTVLFRLETYLIAREVLLSSVRRLAPAPEVPYTAREAGQKPTYGKLEAEEGAGLVPRVPLPEFLANVRGMAELGEQAGFRFAWIDMPINRAEPDLVSRYVNPEYRSAVAAEAEEDGFPLIEVDRFWRRLREPELHIVGHVFHPSARGHERMAEQIAGELVADGLLPAGAKAPPMGGPPPAAEVDTLRFGWSAFTPVHAQLGAWLEAHPEAATAHGLRLELHDYLSGKPQGDDVARGALDAFFTCEVPAVQMVGGRVDLRLVASPGELGRVAVLTRRDRATRLDDLRGRKVGFAAGSTTAMDWAEWSRGLGAVDVPLATDALEGALLAGEVDAIVAWDPWVEDLLQRHPKELLVVKDRPFRSVVALSIPWALDEPGRGRRLLDLLAEAAGGVAKERERWDRVAAERSGWPLAVVRAVTNRNGLLDGTVPPVASSLALNAADRAGIPRALRFVGLPGVAAPMLLDDAPLDGRVSAWRYSPTAEFNPGSEPKAGPGGPPKGRAPGAPPPVGPPPADLPPGPPPPPR